MTATVVTFTGVAATAPRSEFLDFVTVHAVHALAVVAPMLVVTGVLCWERVRIAWSRRALVRQSADPSDSGPIAAGVESEADRQPPTSG